MSSFVTRLPSLLFVAFAFAACKPEPFCGDGLHQGGEFCDDGNQINNDGCNSLCALPQCGNTILDQGEGCDDGNQTPNDGCDQACQEEAAPICGDGIVQSIASEECDDGNQLDLDGCSSQCLEELCGDGVINDDGLEQCDNGAANSNTSPDACRADCTNPSCGDGVKDSSEGCDDGNNVNNDACRDNCSLPACGDGIVQGSLIEECDDSNTIEGDGCSDTCQDEFCGDGITNDTNEECDDSNATGGDGCGTTCLIEFCGDGIVNNNLSEACDDGNNIDNDLCRNSCTVPLCGDGLVSSGEGCDDGNTANGDGCRADCLGTEVCGDGFVDFNEACDDGNNNGADGCAGDCSKLEECGDGILDEGEFCDDGNTLEGDGCNLDCELESGLPTPLRVLAGNLSSGNGQNYNLGHGARLFQGLDADVVLIQEFSFGDNSDAAIRGFVDTNFGANFSFTRELLNAGDIPNGVISRFPILEFGEEDDPQATNREFVWARIDLPNTPRDLWAISLHLLTDGSKRPLEADALVAFIQATIPLSDYLVIGGDLNTETRVESAIVKLGAVVVVGGPFPVDQNGNDNTNAPRNKPFDWVLADADLDANKVDTDYGPFSFINGFVFDSRLFTQSDLNSFFSPVLVSDSAAPSMQHMAVVRDFAIPIE